VSEPEAGVVASDAISRDNLGFLLVKAGQRWNELLARRFAEHGFADVRPAYGSVLVPLFEEDGLRMGEIARRSRLSKQTMTTMVRQVERDGLVERRVDPTDARAARVFLAPRAEEFRPVAESVLAELEAEALRDLAEDDAASLRDWLRELAELEG
jgi:DNA-binding MarR family transcriptional regulator